MLKNKSEREQFVRKKSNWHEFMSLENNRGQKYFSLEDLVISDHVRFVRVSHLRSYPDYRGGKIRTVTSLSEFYTYREIDGIAKYENCSINNIVDYLTEHRLDEAKDLNI